MGRRKVSTGEWRAFLRVVAISFVVALMVAWPSETAMRRLNLFIAFPILFFIILLGVVCDIIGVATTVAAEEPVHARSARKHPGAREGLWLIRRADRVANFCNDLVGDVAGTVSGAAAVAAVYRLGAGSSLATGIYSLAAVAVVSALTVGLKAVGKGYAIREADGVLLKIGRTVHGLKRLLGRDGPGDGRRRRA